MKVSDIRQYFIDELRNENFVVARDGSKTIELMAASFLADEDAIFGTPNQEYIEAEIKWYMSQSTNIQDLAAFYGKTPKAWEHSANIYGEINSNYGKLIFDKMYHTQFINVCNELRKNPNSRRACMVYNRPSIWAEYNAYGKDDFICTNAVTYYVRDGKVDAVVQMRSNDAVFGYKNDVAWQNYVLAAVTSDLYEYGHEVETGNIYWQVQNLHVYERHFDLVQ